MNNLTDHSNKMSTLRSWSLRNKKVRKMNMYISIFIFIYVHFFEGTHHIQSKPFPSINYIAPLK